MTNEEKELLLKDLCARLPYGVMCNILTCFVFEDGTARRGSYDKIFDLDTVTEINKWQETGELEKLKPYLRPMSSMTDKEKKDLLARIVGKDAVKYFQVLEDGSIDNTDAEHQDLYNFSMHWINFNGSSTTSYIDWLNANHFDYRGLIEKGLALEAPEGMYDEN